MSVPHKVRLRRPVREPPRPQPRQLPRTPDDEELLKILELSRLRIAAIGIGGAGCNTITRLEMEDCRDIDTIAMNTDAQHLLITRSKRKLLLGRELCGGLGCGGDPLIGEEAAKESLEEIEKIVEGLDLVFVTCGLGGGTGTGGAPIVAKAARSAGALVIAIVTLPFNMEGRKRMENALTGLEKLEKTCDTIIIVPNERLLQISPTLTLSEAFRVADEILVRGVRGIADTLTKPGLVNVDFADLRTIMEDAGPALIAFGESDAENRAEEAVASALNTPLLEVDIKGGRGALINITAGPSITLEEVNQVVESIAGELNPDADIIWGARIEEDLQDLLRVLLVVTGVSTPYITSRVRREKEKTVRRILDLAELGVEEL